MNLSVPSKEVVHLHDPLAYPLDVESDLAGPPHQHSKSPSGECEHHDVGYADHCLTLPTIP